MDELKSTQGVMINVGENVNRFVGSGNTPEFLSPLIEQYKNTFIKIKLQVEKLAHIESLILQQKCLQDENIKIKLSILRDYVYARCPFYRKDKSTKDIRVIVSRVDLVYDNKVPSIKDMIEDPEFMSKAKDKLVAAMQEEFVSNSNKFFELYD